ncbi:MAG: ATP-binding protein [Hyphomonadaceae bacterium]|nr:ATP-binding protein [Hyphomonadaceae bacterium]
MKSLLPRSLSGQLALVMAGALLVASLVNFVLLLGERQRALLIEQSGAPMARFVDVARDVSASPPERGRPLPIMRQGPSRYQVQAGNPIDNRALPRHAGLEERLHDALVDAGLEPTQIRASVRSIIRPERGGLAQRNRADAGFGTPENGPRPPLQQRSEPDFRPDGGQSQDSGAMRPPREAREIILALQIPDGRWLSSTTIAPEATSGEVFLLGASTFIIFAFVLTAALWIASRVARPLQDLTAAAQKVGAAGEPQEVTVQGPGDVRQTLEAFNAMSRRVSHLLSEKDVMLGALGHDLRTPLASLRIRLESMEPEAERLKAIRTIEEASDLLEDILELARQGRSKEQVQMMDIAILVQDMVEDYAETGAPVSLASFVKGPVRCRPVLFRRALRNLIDNAVSYGERARLSVSRANGEVLVTVEDDGPGMSADALASAADPFYRGDASRNRTTGGAGLGLTLADAIAKAHGGSLALQNHAPHGLAATIRLPDAMQGSA